MQEQLTDSNQSTYDRIFQHPLPRDLRWPDVHCLLAALATVVKAADGSLKIARNGRTLLLAHPQRNVVTAQEAMNIRGFLANSEHSGKAGPANPGKRQ